MPEREFSMASLQGYLMTYKIRPYEAVKEVSAWVERERAERLEKQTPVSAPAPQSANEVAAAST